MSRDWIAAYVSTLGRPKYRRLTLPARAALFHVWLLAGGQDPEATWPSMADLVDVLELDGYPAPVVSELVEREWLDIDDRGRILVHDWDQHQLAATNAARRAYERDRKADWRRAKPGTEPVDPLLPAPSSPDITGSTQLHDNTTQVSPNVRDTSGTRPRPRIVGVNPESVAQAFDPVTYDQQVAAIQQREFARKSR